MKTSVPRPWQAGRYDEQYDKAEAIETQMDEWNSRLLSVRQEKISADNVYQLLLAFDKLCNTFTEVEQRDFMRAFIERIDIYPENPDNGCWIRNIVFNFPMPVQGKEIKSLPLESESTVETVCLLSKLSGAKNHISVKVEMDEMDLTAAESKATYQEIQDWVQEKYGFHVTHLNIAKTKRKCGIIERQNFNLPKSDDSRSPETQKDKEEAIIEAFRHFQMI